MCARALAGGEDHRTSPRPDETPPPAATATNAAMINEYEERKEEREAERDERSSADCKNGLTKAKEKYMKLHDQMLERDLLMSRQRRQRDEQADDLLARGTRIYKKALRIAMDRASTWQESKIYKILFCTTQPAHVITIAAVLCVTSALVPNSTSIMSGGSGATAGHARSGLTSFVYLASFVTHFGSQIWMTFVSGLSLYFALPRHTFGEVQRVLFPRYFTINACLSLTTLLIYVKHHPTNSWDAEIAIQAAGMGGAFFLELLIRLYLTPPLLRLIDLKTSIERAAGVGAEIGRHDPGPLKHCPHYLKIHQAFRRIHVTIAMGNMLTMACTVLHLHHVASKLCVL